MKMRKCSECGKPNRTKKRICKDCQAKQTTLEEQAEAQISKELDEQYGG